MIKLWDWIKSEPIVITQVITAVITLATAFGLDLTLTQTAAIMGMGQLAAALIGRAYVTPTAALAPPPTPALARIEQQ